MGDLKEHLPSFPAPNLEGVLGAIRDVIADLQVAGTGTIGNITQSIISISEMDCGGKWIVYLKTMPVAITKSVWMLITPSMDEVLENYLEPKPARRQGRRGQKGDRKRKPMPDPGRNIRRAINANAYRVLFNPPIPDIDEAIAAKIPGSKLLKGRQMLPGEWIFWTGINVADAILWQWLLIEATETFTVTWMSEMMQSGECKYDQDAGTQFKAGPKTNWSEQGLWKGIPAFPITYNDNMEIGIHSNVDLEIGLFEGHGLSILLAEFLMQCDGSPGQRHIKAYARIVVRNAFNDVIYDQEHSTDIFGSSGGSTAALIDIAALTDRFHSVQFFTRYENIAGVGGFSLTGWGDIAITVRKIISV